MLRAARRRVVTDPAESARQAGSRTPGLTRAIERHILRADLPIELISKTMAALAQATNQYRISEFEIFWARIHSK
jgi:hypothetical protein